MYKTSRLIRISLNQCHTKEFCVFSRESYFINAIENSTLAGGVGRILNRYANPRLVVSAGLHNCLEFSQPLSRLYQAMQTRKTFYNDFLFMLFWMVIIITKVARCVACSRRKPCWQLRCFQNTNCTETFL